MKVEFGSKELFSLGKRTFLRDLIAVFHYLKRELLKEMERDKHCGLAGGLDLVIFIRRQRDKVEVWDNQYLIVVAVDLGICVY